MRADLRNTLASVNMARDAVAITWCFDQVISGDGQSVASTTARTTFARRTAYWEDVFCAISLSQSTAPHSPAHPNPGER